MAEKLWQVLQVKCSMSQKSSFPHVLLNVRKKWQNEPVLLTDV